MMETKSRVHNLPPDNTRKSFRESNWNSKAYIYPITGYYQCLSAMILKESWKKIDNGKLSSDGYVYNVIH